MTYDSAKVPDDEALPGRGPTVPVSLYERLRRRVGEPGAALILYALFLLTVAAVLFVIGGIERLIGMS